VLLADFGISAWLSSDEASTFGAVPYLAPEKLGGRPGDERSDVYAIGAVLYEMLTGAAPFGNGSDKDTQERILTGSYLDPEVLEHQVPHVAPIVRKALALDPEQRYQSAEEMIRALEDILGHQPSREPAARPARLPWLPVLLVVLLIGLLGFLLGWLQGPGQVAHNPTPTLVTGVASTSAEAISALGSALPTPSRQDERLTPTSAEATVVVLDAATTQDTATALPTASPTSPRPPTSTPVSESPSPTAAPTSMPARRTRNTPGTSGAPSPGGAVSRPAWLDPPEGTTLTERPIDFRWQWEGELENDLYFQIRVRTTQDPNGPSWGIELWRATLQNTSIEPAARAAGVQSGEPLWVSVAIGRANRDRSALIEPVLAESPLRSMMWKPSASAPQPTQPRPTSAPPTNPPPPTNTPGPEG
jgi:serine/threonine protein kinase